MSGNTGQILPDPRAGRGRGGRLVAALRRVPGVLAFVLLAAHNLRFGSLGGVSFWLLACGLLFWPRPWARRAAQGLLLFGFLFWLDVAQGLIGMRQAMGAEWGRLAAIMGGVAAWDLLALLALGVRERAGQGARAWTPAAAFLLTVGALAMVQVKVAMPVLIGERFAPGTGWVQALLMGAYAAWVAGKMLDPARTARWRRAVWGLFSLVFFGQLLLGLAGLERFLMTGDLHLPVPALIVAGPLFRGHGFFMLILFGATLLLVGPAWCSHLCYIGAWDNWAAMGKPRPKPLPAWRNTARWTILALVFGAALGLRWAGASAALAVGLAAAFGLAGVALMLTWSRASGAMAHCTTWCPMGLVGNLLGKVSPWRMRMHPECTRCRICSTACRYDALTPADIKAGRPGQSCTLCGDCVNACPHGRMEYAFPGLSASAARAAFIGLAVALHAVFLGVARL